MQSMKRKGQLNALPTAAISIVVFIIVVSLGSLILVGMNDSTTNTDAQDILGEGVTAMSDFSGWTGTLVVVIVAAVILAIVTGLFWQRRMGGRA